MQTGSTKITFKVKRDEKGTNGSNMPDLVENMNQNPIDLSASDEELDYLTEDGENQASQDDMKQLVLYDPSTNSRGQNESVPNLDDFQLVAVPKRSPVLTVGTFTVQCAKCFKWRILPTQERYEQIREHIEKQPFFCDTAREWRANISCDDAPDISQDGSRLWAIDKPNIARPPAGWQRLLRIRTAGSTKFADVYYTAPRGKRLRSMIEVEKYLAEHPEFALAGVQLSQFSFQIPKPLQENYVRKRQPKMPSFDPNHGMTGLSKPHLVNPISWAAPDENTDLQLRGPGFSAPIFESPPFEPTHRPKKRAKKTSVESRNNDVAFDRRTVKVGEPSQFTAVEEPSQPAQVEELSQPIYF